VEFALLLALCGAGYLLGSIPWGYLLGRWVAGVDIRTLGSGNIGATNVGRVLGWHWFGVVFVLDLLKGAVPTVAGPWLLSLAVPQGSVPAITTALLIGAAAICGHLWPIWLRFAGGKGVATGLGVLLALAPYTSIWPVLAAAAVFGLTLLLTRYVSLGSILAALTYSLGQLALLLAAGTALTLGGLSLILFALLVPGLVLWRHRANMLRLWHGTESKIGQRAASQEAPAA